MNEIIKSHFLPTKMGRPSSDKLLYGFLANFNSENTKVAYKRDLEDFFRFYKDAFPKYILLDVDHEVITLYKQFLKNKDLKPTTINRKLACLSKFFRFLVQRGFCKHNPVEFIDRLSISNVSKTEDLSNKEVRCLLNSVNRDKGSGKLHYAILMVLFTRGIRKAEVFNLKIKDFRKLGDCFVLYVTRKGGSQDEMRITHDCADAIVDYLLWCDDEGYQMNIGSPLFRPTQNNAALNDIDTKKLTYNDEQELKVKACEKKISGTAISKIVEKYAKIAGIDRNISPHSGRATLISELLDMGEPIHEVAREVRHKDIKTTLSYWNRKRNTKDSLVEKVSY